MINEISKMQIEIMRKMMFSGELLYSKIHEVTENHDLFNYHLRELVKNGYLEKNQKSYSLTKKGKQFVSNMEEDGTLQQQFKVGMFITLVREKRGKYQMLLFKRLKHPHFGYIGSVTGKLKWGQSIEDNAIREVKEELNIDVSKVKIVGVDREIFRDKDMNPVGDGVFFDVVIEEWSGTISEKSVEGEYFWYDIDKILELDRIFSKGFELGLPHLRRYLKDRKNYMPYIVENGTEGLDY
ncbi:NUDIX domain-containing protein [Candidatus Dojkabacteria bacterium]|nr:NUDIX domain-containing protein [Candidatus Dojkabacteria bacterium]